MDKRILLGIVLWALIAIPLLYLSNKLFPPVEVPVEPTTPTTPPQPAHGGQEPGPGPDPGPGPEPGAGPAGQGMPDHPLVIREIKNDHIRAVFTSEGASLQSLELLTYKERYLPLKEDPRGDKNLELIYEAQSGHRPFLFRVVQGEKDPIDTLNWKVTSPEGELPLVFEWHGPTGLKITKRFSLSKASPYAIELDVEMASRGGKHQFEIEANAGLSYEDNNGADIIGLLARAEWDEKGARRKITLVEEKKRVTDLVEDGVDKAPEPFGKEAGPGWIAVANRYFVAALVPMADPAGRHPVQESWFLPLIDAKERAFLATWEPEAPPGSPEEKARNKRLDAAAKIGLLAVYKTPVVDLGTDTWKWRAILYAGPKTAEDLEPLADLGLDRTLDYGWFGFFSKILLAILGVLHKVFGNWGWSIIFLTVIVRLAIFPLNRKAQISAHKMSKLQPKMVELRERHGKDKERLGKEMMELYRQHGVNPLGGCLPVFLQLPILYGLYKALLLTLDLRQQPFVGWIRDLSQPDMLFQWHFPGIGCCFGAPLMKTEFFNLLPVIMTLTWFVQSLTYPKPQDPQAAQTQKMMMYMPFFFGMMMFNVSSGLILYWMTSTFLGIIEQQYIKRVILPKH